MKLSELHYLQLLDETRQALVSKDENVIYYLQELERRLKKTETKQLVIVDDKNVEPDFVQYFDRLREHGIMDYLDNKNR